MNSCGLDGCLFPFLILEIYDGSKFINFDNSDIFTDKVLSKILKLDCKFFVSIAVFLTKGKNSLVTDSIVRDLIFLFLLIVTMPLTKFVKFSEFASGILSPDLYLLIVAVERPEVSDKSLAVQSSNSKYSISLSLNSILLLPLILYIYYTTIILIFNTLVSILSMPIWK